MKEKYLIITFESTHVAIKTEKVLDTLEIEMIPTPRQITTNCGISIKARVDDLDKIKNLMGQDYGKMNQSYIVDKNSEILTFKKV